MFPSVLWHWATGRAPGP